MSKELALRPSYWASVSGGKDSLYMLNVILNNLQKYPLDGVVHFELEIDYPFITNVINLMERSCKQNGIPFVRIKPENKWEELYEKYGYPARMARWCNSNYKLLAKKRMVEFLKTKGFYLVSYIGYCADEEKRFAKRLDSQRVERYPLVEEGIKEETIYAWAKKQLIFNHYYETQFRCGCMGCPMSSKMNWAYLYKYYPGWFKYFIEKMKQTEKMREEQLGRPFSVTSSNPKYNAEYIENIVKQKYLEVLNYGELYSVLGFDDIVSEGTDYVGFFK